MTTALDPERQKQAKEYARTKRLLWLVDQAFSLIYALVWLVTGGSVALRAWLAGFIQYEWLLLAAYVAIFGGLYFLINLPLSLYGEFTLPHRYGQSNQSLKEWVLDQAKGLAIGVPLGLFLIEMLYLALQLAGASWWLWVTAGMLLFNVLLSNLAPVLIMPLFNKFIPLGDEHAELANRLLQLAQKSNTRVQGVFKMDMSRRSKAANAFLTGLGNTRRIVLGDTLINEFTLDEIETVLAHELGHHVNKDIPLLIVFGTLLTALGLFLASLGMNWAISAFGLSGVADPAGLPALMTLLGLYQLVVMPIENAVSRWRETLADRYALTTTNKGEAFATAFVRLANQNLGEVNPEPWVVWLFYSHPPLNERISMAKNWKNS